LFKFKLKFSTVLYWIIDIGNTRAKFFSYDKDQWQDHNSVSLDSFAPKAETLIADPKSVNGLIFSDVGGVGERFFKKKSYPFPLLAVSSQMLLPFKNNYQTPHLLGADRLALVAAAAHKHPQTNVLIIDLGTCITYDFLSSDAIYHGGAISPGFQMRYKALHQYTGKLPLLMPEQISQPEGICTNNSIHAGIYYGIVDEILGRIEHYRAKYEFLTVILTGGDANKLPKTLKNSIFAHSNFMAEGMLHLLELNIDS
jgi:type III pantothenate kinase